MNTPSRLGGHLRMIAGGHQFGLPLGRVERVALANTTRRLAPRSDAEAWWRGIVLEDREAVPVLSLAALVGTRAEEGDALVYWRLGRSLIAFECVAVRGIVPATTQADKLSPAWFGTGRDCFPRVLRTPDAPVLVITPENLLPMRRLKALSLLMSETEPSIEKLWELSELENKLALAPTAAGYRELAKRYAEEGWREDSLRITERAEQLAAAESECNPSPSTHSPTPEATKSADALFSGAFNPRVLVELLQVLHLTGKSGELRLLAPGGANVRIVLDRGSIIGADAADAAPGEDTLVRAIGLPGGRYEFTVGTPLPDQPGALNDTPAAIRRLAENLR